MRTNVKRYTDRQLLAKVKSLKSFKGIPEGYWILGVQSNEDQYNQFDDKFYVFHGERFIMVTSGTTNAGTTGLKGYHRYNRQGCAVIKTNEWYYDLWRPGKHRGRMRALRQSKPIKFFRDWNKNNRAEQIGKMREGIIGINFHTATYGMNMGFIRRFIGGWSTGCAVANITSHYYRILDLCWGQPKTTYCLIDEF